MFIRTFIRARRRHLVLFAKLTDIDRFLIGYWELSWDELFGTVSVR